MTATEPTMKILVSILKESALFLAMDDDEKISFLNRLLREYPYHGKSQN